MVFYLTIFFWWIYLTIKRNRIWLGWHEKTIFTHAWGLGKEISLSRSLTLEEELRICEVRQRLKWKKCKKRKWRNQCQEKILKYDFNIQVFFFVKWIFKVLVVPINWEWNSLGSHPMGICIENERGVKDTVTLVGKNYITKIWIAFAYEEGGGGNWNKKGDWTCELLEE